MENKASQIINGMMENDLFSQWLGIKILQAGEGFCTLHLKVRKEMLNGFGIVHGGITYSLADSALAFASNSHGRKCVSVETSISHTCSLLEGDEIYASAEELHCSNKIAVYQVRIKKKDESLVALFKGTVYRSSKDWQVDQQQKV